MGLARRHLLISGAALPGWVASAEPRALRIPQVSARAELPRSYPALLLAQALAAAGLPVRLSQTREPIPQNRAFLALGREQDGLDIVWSMTTVEREAQARPIRVPLFKGLFGWRLLLASPEVAERMRHVQSLAELRRFTMVQGLEWPDTGILQANGLQVVTSSTYDAMFKQLRLGRAEAFPRSVEEVWWELGRYGQGLTVVPEICLHYPAALYYFVAPADEELAQAIEVGLQRLRASGAFDRLFLKHHGDDIARAQLEARRVIELRNPLLPKQTPLDKPELWFRPQG